MLVGEFDNRYRTGTSSIGAIAMSPMRSRASSSPDVRIRLAALVQTRGLADYESMRARENLAESAVANLASMGRAE
jgi:hypothetical protein